MATIGVLQDFVKKTGLNWIFEKGDCLCSKYRVLLVLIAAELPLYSAHEPANPLTEGRSLDSQLAQDKPLRVKRLGSTSRLRASRGYVLLLSR